MTILDEHMQAASRAAHKVFESKDIMGNIRKIPPQESNESLLAWQDRVRQSTDIIINGYNEHLGIKHILLATADAEELAAKINKYERDYSHHQEDTELVIAYLREFRKHYVS